MSDTNAVVIIDYQLGNLFSVYQACLHAGLHPMITSEKRDLLNAQAVILPGVGAFGDAMMTLKKLDLIEPLKTQVKKGVPFLGICLGMQLLFTESEEFGHYKGIGLIEGSILRFSEKDRNSMKIPQIGWNTVYHPDPNKWDGTPLATIEQNKFMYFVHSYYAKPEHSDLILTQTNYAGLEYCSAIHKENVIATQFHPEKSGEIGIKFYRNWAKMINEYYRSEG
ncbi:MAG TPA: imidazole glycerol phosphate synthase subunit HisH [Bacteroidota bacterium]|nr:imidazole glycerol phosphate synthase subunit HisH [Bacteroidota bacterium]